MLLFKGSFSNRESSKAEFNKKSVGNDPVFNDDEESVEGEDMDTENETGANELTDIE
ncbi:hypothetical protein KQI76_06650 [Amphibacillus sp. MSJ-3]|uniref:hypothetical protein n=1 Tax=Amphibacillus sp. MSJ-3 TaxID=2841505 RepID=UPI001C0EFD1B|nr:hypothetical protein [Amphibacillus sp. MSJ-3]MBU5594840.1 hypothetical protein [Amphibacillus sp. MSJ-3]